MAQSTGSSFASGLLAGFNASTKAAQEERRKAAKAQAEKRKQLEEKREQEKTERIRREADRIVQRNVPATKMRNMRRTRPQQRTKTDQRPRARASSPVRKPYRRPRPQSGPPKPLPGMEFVVRKTENKKIHVPHSSDYSDMFGEKYLVGVELKVTQDMAKRTAEAAKENKIILKEKEDRRRQKLKEAEEITRKENELRAKGLLTEKEKRRIRCEISAKDWVAVDQPAPAGAKLKDLVTRPVAAESAPKVRTEQEAEKVEAKITERDVSEQKRLLRQRVLAMAGGKSNDGKSNGGAVKPSKKRAREVDEIVEPRKSRRRLSDAHEGRRKPRRGYSDDDEPSPVRRSGSRRNGYSRRDDFRSTRDRGYNSEDWSDNDSDDDDDDEDLYGIDALDREEEKSSRIAAIEDKREKKREIQHRREKQRRRDQFESKYG